MSMLSPYDWSTTASSNTDLGGGTVANSQMYPSGVDNAFREMMAEIARTLDSLGGVNTVGGTASAITVTIGEDWSAYATGQLLAVKASSASTGATTLNVTPKSGSALGAKAIRRQGDSALQANDMLANGVYLLRYDASYNSAAGAWVLLNPAPVWSAVTGTPTTLSGYGITDGIKSVKTQVFTSSGTYTPSSGMAYAVIEMVGGGGGGGGAASASSGQLTGAGGGGSGAYSRKVVTAAGVGSSQTVTIGAAGSGASAGNNNGGAGGDTSVGTLCVAKGGSGGAGVGSTGAGLGGAGGVASSGTGDVRIDGGSGTDGRNATSGASSLFLAAGGLGGNGVFGAGGMWACAANGHAASGYGGGGGGGSSLNGGSTASGGAGTAGLIIITEFCTQ